MEFAGVGTILEPFRSTLSDTRRRPWREHGIDAAKQDLTMRCMAVFLVCWLVRTATGSAQVLITGETGGAGAQAVAVAANLIQPKDFGTLANFWAQYGYGVADRVDAFVTYGNISVFGETQHYVGVGSNIAVLRRGQHGLDLSVFDNVSVPVTRRNQAATLLVTLALVASRPVKLGSVAITPYGGFNTVAPIGQRALGVFTPVETLHTGIAGVAIPLGKTWSAFVEYDPGPNLRSGGVGLAVIFPRQP